ncbi:MAG: PKD domain-containing protein [Flavobacteriales bacterium]
MKSRVPLGSLTVLCASAVLASDPVPQQRFIENKGQWPSHVLYRAGFGPAVVFVERTGLTWSMLQPDAAELLHDHAHAQPTDVADIRLRGHAWRMRFVDANKSPSISSSDQSTTYLNYFLGNQPRNWADHVGIHGQVHYADVWPGVDIRLHTEKAAFKYDVLLDAGARVGQVKLAYEGSEALEIAADGRLVIRTSVGELVEMAPVAWYADGAHEGVECFFTLKDAVVGFGFPDADTLRPVVIDPMLVGATLSGTGDLGLTSNFGHSATYDAQGNIYTGARCFGQGYPVTTGAFQTTFANGGADIAVSKLDPAGSALIWATYFGGDGSDLPNSMVVDAAGNFSVFGTTTSTDYPCSIGAFDNTYGGGSFAQDLVVSKVDITGGALIGSTYVGGAGEDGAWGNKGEIATDATGSIYVVATTMGNDFPVSTGAVQTTFGGTADAVVFKLSPDLSTLNWSTYLGGAGEDFGFGIEVLANGDVLACGYAGATGIPVSTGAYQTAYQGGQYDGYVVHIAGNGTSVAAGTYFGSISDDQAFFVEADTDGDVHIYGFMGSNIPIVPSGGYATGGTMYVSQFDPTLSTLVTSSSISVPGGLGGPDWQPIAFLVDNCDHIYISGYSLGVSPPLTSDAILTSGGFYLAAFEADMAGLLFGTYYGALYDHVDGGTSRFDKQGVVYQGVCTGGGFPTTPNAFSTTQPVGWDMGVFKIDFQLSGVVVSIGASATTGCAPLAIDFGALGAYQSVLWNFGDGSTATTDSAQHSYVDPGTYTVTLIGYDPASCNLSDTAVITVVVSDPVPVTPTFTVVQAGGCLPYAVVVTNSTPGTTNSYLWDMGDGTTYTTTNVTHTYPGAGTYTITLTVTENTCGNVSTTSEQITITEPLAIEALFSALQEDPCGGFTVNTTNLSTGPAGLVYTWNMGDGTTLSGTNVTYTYAAPGTYTISLLAVDTICDDDATFSLDVQVETSPLIGAGILVPNIFSPNHDGLNDTFFPIEGAGGNVDLRVWDRWGMKMFETSGIYEPWNGRTAGNKPVPDGVYFFILEYSIPCTGSRIEGKKEGYVHVVGSTM